MAVAEGIGYTPAMDGAVFVQFPGLFCRRFERFDFRYYDFGITRIAGVHVGLKAFAVSWIFLHELLVPPQRLIELIRGNIVEEYA